MAGQRAARDITVARSLYGQWSLSDLRAPDPRPDASEEEGLSLSEAVAAVLPDNFFGLELDARCSQIAAFNLALLLGDCWGTLRFTTHESGLFWARNQCL